MLFYKNIFFVYILLQCYKVNINVLNSVIYVVTKSVTKL